MSRTLTREKKNESLLNYPSFTPRNQWRWSSLSTIISLSVSYFISNTISSTKPPPHGLQTPSHHRRLRDLHPHLTPPHHHHLPLPSPPRHPKPPPPRPNPPTKNHHSELIHSPQPRREQRKHELRPIHHRDIHVRALPSHQQLLL